MFKKEYQIVFYTQRGTELIKMKLTKRQAKVLAIIKGVLNERAKQYNIVTVDVFEVSE